MSDVENMNTKKLDELRLVIGYEAIGGWRGYSFLQTGHIYAPYVPLYITPVISLAGWDDAPLRLIIGSRFHSEYYGKVTI